MYILFIGLLAYNFIKGSFEYEKVTRFKFVLIPLYEAFMFLLSTRNFHLTEYLLAFVLLIVGIGIGWFTSSQTKIQDENKVDRYGRPILKVKRGWPYLVGQITTFVIIMGVEIFYGEHVNVSHELFKELLKDFSVLALVGSKSAWFIWLLNVATSFSYGIILLNRYPKIREAIRKKKKRS